MSYNYGNGGRSSYTQVVVDGEAAERVYKILKESYCVKNGELADCNLTVDVKIEYADGILRIEERVNDHLFYLSDVLFFFVGYDNFYSLTEYYEDGEVQSYSVNDDDGKYFVRPPKTEWEKLWEERQNQEAGSDDLPF